MKEDKILFVEEAGRRIYMWNSSMDALREAQRAFAGEEERLGLKDDNDVMAMIKEFREEMKHPSKTEKTDWPFFRCRYLGNTAGIDIEKPEIMSPAQFMEWFL